MARIDGRLLFSGALLQSWLHQQVEHDVRPKPPAVPAGSHDPLLDWAARESGSGLALLTAGSSDGLVRHAAGEAVAAAIHIRAQDGSYNQAAVRALGMPDLVLIHWAQRCQGLVLPPGTDADIRSVGDAARQGRRLARRQIGAGAQLLLEQELAAAGLRLSEVAWSETVYRTHFDVAAAIQDKRADAGITIEAVARRFALPFLPSATESSDLAWRRRDVFEPTTQALLRFAQNEAFREQAAALGGHDVRSTEIMRFNG